VFFVFTLTAPEMIYADTVGTGFDTSLFLQDAMGRNITDPGTVGGAACNDDNGVGCGTGLQSIIVARLPAGTYYLVLSGCGAGAGTIHFQHLPAGGTTTQVGPRSTAQTAAGTTINRSLHINAGNGALSRFYLFWPHIEVAKELQRMASSGINPMTTPLSVGNATATLKPGTDKPLYTIAESPWKDRQVRAKFLDLARELGELGAWVRLQYVYPYPHVDEVIALMNEGKVLPYLDIPFQHASKSVLKAMKRPAAAEDTLKRLETWRRTCPDLTVRSTFMNTECDNITNKVSMKKTADDSTSNHPTYT
jgi:hypothetical protein